MPTPVWRGPLICLALLGAFLMSCGGTTPPPSTPAAPVPAQPDPAEPRPGGLPVDPGAFPGTGGALDEAAKDLWAQRVDEACEDAGHPEGCLRLEFEYYDAAGNRTGQTGPGENYEVTDVSFPERVNPGNTITVRGTCTLTPEPCTTDKATDEPRYDESRHEPGSAGR